MDAGTGSKRRRESALTHQNVGAKARFKTLACGNPGLLETRYMFCVCMFLVCSCSLSDMSAHSTGPHARPPSVVNDEASGRVLRYSLGERATPSRPIAAYRGRRSLQFSVLVLREDTLGVVHQRPLHPPRPFVPLFL